MNERIKLLRIDQKMTQEQFADALSIKRNTVASYEIGKTGVSDRVLDLICIKFNVNRRWLLTGEGEMYNATTKRQELIEFMNGLLIDDGTDEMRQFKIDLIATLAQMSPEQWRAAADFFKAFNASANKNEEE